MLLTEKLFDLPELMPKKSGGAVLSDPCDVKGCSYRPQNHFSRCRAKHHGQAMRILDRHTMLSRDTLYRSSDITGQVFCEAIVVPTLEVLIDPKPIPVFVLMHVERLERTQRLEQRNRSLHELAHKALGSVGDSVYLSEEHNAELKYFQPIVKSSFVPHVFVELGVVRRHERSIYIFTCPPEPKLIEHVHVGADTEVLLIRTLNSAHSAICTLLKRE